MELETRFSNRFFEDRELSLESSLATCKWLSTNLWPVLHWPKRCETSKWNRGLVAWICKDSLKHKQIDLLRSAQKQAKFQASEGEAPSPSDHPAPCHIHSGGNLLTPVRHKPAASIGSILTLSKFNLATLNYSVVNCTSIECLIDPAKVWRGGSTRCQTSSVY